MPAYKTETGTWYVSFYYRKQDGNNTKKKKTGFSTKRDAQKWERDFKEQHSGNLEMKFRNFVAAYCRDVKPRIKYSTWITKERILRLKILPAFGERSMAEITTADIVQWQNGLIEYRSSDGEPYTDTYLRTIQNQMSALFNHAVRYYGLKVNPVRQAGRIGRDKARPMEVWTRSEYLRFAEAIKDEPLNLMAFELLYWCGLRVGEMMALTPDDFDFDNEILHVNKTYSRIHKTDIITSPKTEKSVRDIVMPDFLCDELSRYRTGYLGRKHDQRIFTMSLNYLHTVMKRGSEKAGIKSIRIHDLRHSHVSLLISMGFSAVDIADRMGHESIDITLHYAHMFPNRQNEMAAMLNRDHKEAILQ